MLAGEARNAKTMTWKNCKHNGFTQLLVRQHDCRILHEVVGLERCCSLWGNAGKMPEDGVTHMHPTGGTMQHRNALAEGKAKKVAQVMPSRRRNDMNRMCLK
jgi:hypothetical protein